jgi:hypothetical protein
VSRQLSLFSAQMRPPAVADLEGLLCGTGHLVRRQDTARLSVLVTGAWRADELRAGFAELGLDGGDPVSVATSGEEQVSVRTSFDPRLGRLALRWSRGAHPAVPADLQLDGHRLRWWLLASGVADEQGWVLTVNASAQQLWPGVGAALAAAGLPGTFLGPRAGGPAYRVTGQRRIARLRELVGDPPNRADPDCWPSV